MTAMHDTDPVPGFTSALSTAARRQLVLNYESLRCIRAACERLEPAELARIVGSGIGWRSPANAAGLMLYRLRREAGQLDDREGDGE